MSKQGNNREPIAIIGIGCRFPGGANSPEDFWELLVNGIDAISEVPADRWNLKHFYDPDPQKPGSTYTRWGGFVENIDRFDPRFFGISPREAMCIDPQQRMLLEIAWEALEDGGQAPENLAGTNTGVFIGISSDDYNLIQLGVNDRNLINAYTHLGGQTSIAANRISYIFDFKGPSMAIDTACSSSLVAVHTACRNLWDEDCIIALAGSVNVLIRPEGTIGFSKTSMLSPNGRCRSFDAQADGYVRSEGAGMVVLKPLSRALADQDSIYAVIRGCAVNQDGRTNGITVPNRHSQEAVIKDACQQGGISPQQVQYIEAHGIGTPVGDPIEANALGAVLAHPVGDACIVGSVKSNIGHLESASGIAGLIKVAMALKHRKIPPNLHFETPNPKIPFEELRLRVPVALESWPANHNGAPRLAGINSFGFGGTNAHALLAEAPHAADSRRQASLDGQACLLPLSARSPEALQAFAQSYKDFLTDEKNKEISLSDLCCSASLRRSHHHHRLTLAAHSKSEFIECLDAFLAGSAHPGLSSGRVTQKQSPPGLAFVFSGIGQQWQAMGRQLLEKEPLFYEIIKQCDALFRQHVTWSLLAELMADEEHSRINDTAEIAQPAIFSVQAALAALWRSWGIVPDAIVGHSVGEVAAAHVAGVLSLQDAVQVIFHRSRLHAQTAGQGKMLAVELPAEEAVTLFAGQETQVNIGAVNSSNAVTLTGNASALEKIAASLEQQQVFCRFLRVDVPYHSPLMEPLLAELTASLQSIQPQSAKIPLFSTVTGQRVAGSEINAAYWARNFREPVLFAATIEAMILADHTLFLEIGAHPVLSAYISECLAKTGYEGAGLASLRRQESEQLMLLGAFGKLYTLGYPVDWHRLYPEGGQFVRLPPYPWQRERYWNESDSSRQARLGLTSPRDLVEHEVHPLLGGQLKSAHTVWDGEIDRQHLAYLSDHRIQGEVVYPGAAYVEMALAAAREIFGKGVCMAEELAFQKALFLPENELLTLQLILEADGACFRIYSRVEHAWVQHATGKLVRHQQGKTPQPGIIKEIRKRCTDEIMSQQDCYRKLHELGFQYGPLFQSIVQIWSGKGEALCALRVPRKLESEIDDYLIHPAILDACFQSLIAIIDEGEDTYLPVYIEKIQLHFHTEFELWSHARLTEQTTHHIKGDIQLLDDAGNVLVDIQGFRCQSLAKMVVAEQESLLYKYQWYLREHSSQKCIRSAVYLSSPRQITESLQPEAARLSAYLERKRYYEKIKPQLDALSVAYIVNAFQQLGWAPQLHQRFSVDALLEQLGIVSQHHRLLGQMLEILQEEGVLAQVNSEWEIIWLPEAKKELQAVWKTLLGQYPAYQAELMLMGRCGGQLAEALRNEAEPLSLIFSRGTVTADEHFYQDAPGSRIYNLLVQQAISSVLAQLPEGATIRILEIGAGMGGMTSYVLPKLPKHWTEYVFTDASEQFTAQAAQKFRHYPFVQYQLLDIGKDPVAQGLEAHSFDLILASDTLYASNGLRQTQANIKQLLASEGWLILVELTSLTPWREFVLGLQKDWQRFSDVNLVSAQTILSLPKWQNLLAEIGYGEVRDLSDTAENAEKTVILAKGPFIQAPPTTFQKPETPGSWLIFTDNKGVGQALAERLQALREIPVFISAGKTYQRTDAEHFLLRPAHPEDMQQLLETVSMEQPACRGIIHFWSIDTYTQEETTQEIMDLARTAGCISVLHLVQAIAKMDWTDFPDLWLVTQGTQSVGGLESISAAQSPLWGLGRVIINEHPNFHTRIVDIDPAVSPEGIQSLFEELWSNELEDEIALRGDTRYEHKLTSLSLTDIEDVRNKTMSVAEQPPFRLENLTPGMLDNLIFQTMTRQPPCPGKVEIQVLATALNFKDVVKALNKIDEISLEKTLSGQSLGLECTGKITAIGEGVTGFRVGDEVMALAPGSVSTHAVTDACFVVSKPAHLNFEEAATLPIVFWTAYYALHNLTKINQGERILIHAATGGVGLFAIQIAQQAGAEIFATAGNPEKRRFLQSIGIRQVMDSRSLAFADEIMERTHGEGVDIILNSLPGQTIAKSMSLLKPCGRFIDISNIYSDSQVGLRPFQKDLSFFAFDLDQLMLSRRQYAGALFREAMQYFTEHAFHPLPHRVFPISAVESAFRCMAQAQHIGKIVLSLQNTQDVVAALPSDERITFRTDATYLITGGLSGFGFAAARWLTEHGARHMVLMGRSGASLPAIQDAIKKLQKKGTEIAAVKADVTQASDVARVMAEIERSMPPLRGIIHAATVYDDAVLLQLNEERMKKVMAPKASGAWNLHVHSLHVPLDFFVLFSSFSSLAGNPGQGNYAAANAFMDALARYRRTQGLPALTVNWGAIAEAGYAAENAEVSKHLHRIGIKALPPQQALNMLGNLLRLGAVQAAVSEIDWQQWGKQHAAGTSPRFFHLTGDLGLLKTNESEEGLFSDIFLSMEPAKRQQLLASRISELVTKTLGIAPGKMDMEQSLADMGLDSLVATELSNRIKRELDVEVPTMKLLGGLSVNRIITHINEQLTEAASAAPSPGQPKNTRIDTESGEEELLEKVEQLTEV
ncbi:MAG: SDR family NAD(P)-dependent oxidoreductase [Gammaproteobacteria bacterium]|nr:SDR family NAD(P)-dependent oxidoreductase [Gammaproteobacteria bacterium]